MKSTISTFTFFLYIASSVSIVLAQTIALPSDSLVDSKLLSELRENLRYKFAFDFVTQHHHGEYLPGADTIRPSNPRALEAFTCYNHYQLFRCASFDGKNQHFLLQEGSDWPLTLYLFDTDTVHATLLDKFESSGEATFDFDSINGGNILRIEEETTGSGFYGHHLFLYTIFHNKFIEQFHCYLSFLNAMLSDTARRGTGTVKYIDLNNDGYLDILLETSVDLLDPSENLSGSNNGEPENAKVLRQVSRKVKKFIWNKITLTFEEAQ